MDHSAVSIRSIDEPWLEEINSAGTDQYDRNGGSDVAKEVSAIGEWRVASGECWWGNVE